MRSGIKGMYDSRREKVDGKRDNIKARQLFHCKNFSSIKICYYGTIWYIDTMKKSSDLSIMYVVKNNFNLTLKTFLAVYSLLAEVINPIKFRLRLFSRAFVNSL
jgi:hypothetical protein